MKYSGNIRKNLEYLSIRFNEDAVVVLTKRDVPIQLKFVASLGRTFNYCQDLDDSSVIDVFVSMKKIIQKCDSYIELFHVKHELNGLSEQILGGMLPKESPTEAQLYIRELMCHSAEFLRKNKEIIVISSDKGGKAVIMDRTEYLDKMRNYLDENISLRNYERVEASTSSVLHEVESDYGKAFYSIKQFSMLDKALKDPLTNEPFTMPLLYGGPKIHKENIPMRPIIASTDMIGKFLSEWLLEKLKLIAVYLNKYNILNSAKLISELKGFTLETGQKLFSLDCVSMFTNVDVKEVFKIIEGLYHIIQTTTSVPMNVDY